MPRRLAQPRYFYSKFLDPCFYCQKYKCQNTHEAEMLADREELHNIAVRALALGTRRTGPKQYKKKPKGIKRVRRNPHYITFSKQERYNIDHYKPRYLPTREEQLLRRYGY